MIKAYSDAGWLAMRPALYYLSVLYHRVARRFLRSPRAPSLSLPVRQYSFGGGRLLGPRRTQVAKWPSGAVDCFGPFRC